MPSLLTLRALRIITATWILKLLATGWHYRAADGYQGCRYYFADHARGAGAG